MYGNICKKFIGVCIIESNAFIRKGLMSYLERDCYKINAELRSVDELVDFVCSKNITEHDICDICIVGIAVNEDLETIDETLRTIKSCIPDTHIIIMSSKLDEDIIVAFSKNADGYILNDIPAEALMRSMDLVMLGEKVFPTGMVDIISKHNNIWDSTEDRSVKRASELSKREIQVLNCLAKGDSNKVIANNLSIADSTVKVHLKAILRKLSVSNRTQAALWAVNNVLDKDANYIGDQ